MQGVAACDKCVFFEQNTNTGMKKDITELYSFIDDFCKIYSEYEKRQLLPTNKKRNRSCSMALSVGYDDHDNALHILC